MYFKIHVTCKLYVVLALSMCDCLVIIWFDFCSFCENDIRSKLVPFYLKWRALPCGIWGKKVSLIVCVGEAITDRAKRQHVKEVLYIWCVLLYYLWEKTQNLESMGEVATLRDYILEETISCQLWVGGSPDLSMWQYGVFLTFCIVLDFLIFGFGKVL